MDNIEIRMLKELQAREKTGDGHANFYEKIDAGLLPKPVKVGSRGVRWPAHELDAVLIARIAGASEEAVKALVSRLHEIRQEKYQSILKSIQQ